MKNLKNWGLIGASLLMALIAAWASHAYLSNREAEIRQALVGNIEQVAVVVPKGDLQAGDTLHGEIVASRPMPKDLVPTGAITPDEFVAFEGLTLKQSVARGTPLLKHLLVGANTDDSFSTLLKKGQRALTFTVDEKTSTAHLMRPGDYVDVVLGPKANGDSSSDSSSGAGSSNQGFGVLKQHVKVLATGARTVADQAALSGSAADANVSQGLSDYQTITLAVETREVGLFLAALKFVDSGKASLTFLLRNPGDDGRTRFPAGTPTNVVETYSGGNASHGELNAALTEAIGTAARAVTDSNGNAKLYQKYNAEKSEAANENLAGSDRK